MGIQHPRRIFLVALIVAWLFDFLFWQKSPGVSFLIYVVLCIATGFLLCGGENRRPAAVSLILLPPILFFATFTWIRREPFTLFVDFLLTLGGIGVLAVTLLGGKWLAYNLADYVVRFLGLAGSLLSRAGALWLETRRAEPTAAPPPRPAQKQVAPVLRGLVLAVPLVALLGAMLAAADPVFSRQLNGIFSLLRVDNLPEYLFRAFYILIGAYLLAGAFLHGLVSSRDTRLYAEGKSWLPPFLGWTEAVIVLGSVSLLFAFFVAVQAQYFFGGQANITTSGYTYADYARRGFGELVGVVVISLLLLLGLSAVTRRENLLQRRVFSGLGIALVGLVIVILVSAYQRLLLYESAYGFSRLRTYTHVLMVWLGVLLVAVIFLELIGRQRSFALAVILGALGFGVTLNLINVDAFIVRQNVVRAQSGYDLDMPYLATLSEDSFPALIAAFTDPTLPANLHDQAAAAITCHNQMIALSMETGPSFAWQSYNLSQAQARQLLTSFQSELKPYQPVMNSANGWVVRIHQKEYSCFSERGMED